MDTISIHAPQWGATGPRPKSNTYTYPISIHAPQWGATQGGDCAGHRGEFQSTHPSGVRLSSLSSTVNTKAFQSTHPSGVRLNAYRVGRLRFDFNPRTPVGCDPKHLQKTRQNKISIHAPQWGATHGRGHHRPTGPDFNPRTPVGCDHNIGTTMIRAFGFQSTHPSGVRLHTSPRKRKSRDFNPRTPVGCDQMGRLPPSARFNFNPRTPVGCDWASAYHQGPAYAEISIHAPQWGATRRSTSTLPRR